MKTPHVVGTTPWLPWPLSRSPWWTEPVRAERAAALRIGIAALLLIDLFISYLPEAGVFFGQGSLGGIEVFHWAGRVPNWAWSLFYGVDAPVVIWAGLILWTLAVASLLVGFWSRLSAVVVWVLAVSFMNINPFILNGGDQMRGIILFYLMLMPCGAAWSVDNWLARRKGEPGGVSPRVPEPEGLRLAARHIPAWPLRLLFIQMVIAYFFNGVYKLVGEQWREGSSLYYVLTDLSVARFSYAEWPTPYWFTQLFTWATMFWEIMFPMLVYIPSTRVISLWLGVSFHLGIAATMDLGMFPFYMMTLYLPLVPWERWADRPRESVKSSVLRKRVLAVHD